MVKEHLDLAHRQGHQRTVGRVGAQHFGGDQRRDHIHLVAAGHQQAAVGGGDQLLSARSTARQLYPAQRDGIDHPQAGAAVAHPALAGDKQQAFQLGAGAAEGDGIGSCIQLYLHLRAAPVVEGQQLTALRPAAAPQRAIGRHGQIVHPHVAEVAEVARHRVEALDAIA